MRYPFEEKDFLGNRLRQVRLKFGFKQEDIAKTLNISRSTYSYYELGVTRPDPATLGKLAYYYDVPIEVFYDFDLDWGQPEADSSTKHSRTTRLGNFEISKIADLKPEERQLILLIRSNESLTAQAVLDSLEQQIDQANKKK